MSEPVPSRIPLTDLTRHSRFERDESPHSEHSRHSNSSVTYEMDYGKPMKYYTQLGKSDHSEPEPPLHVVFPNGNVCLGVPLNYKTEDNTDIIDSEIWLHCQHTGFFCYFVFCFLFFFVFFGTFEKNEKSQLFVFVSFYKKDSNSDILFYVCCILTAFLIADIGVRSFVGLLKMFLFFSKKKT